MLYFGRHPALVDFAYHFISSLGLQKLARVAPKEDDPVRVTIILRKDYFAHPRIKKPAERKVISMLDLLLFFSSVVCPFFAVV